MELMAATDPFVLFRLWFEAASAAEPEDPTAMTLGTATADGRVSVRVMLMKGFGGTLLAEDGAKGGTVFRFTVPSATMDGSA